MRSACAAQTWRRPWVPSRCKFFICLLSLKKRIADCRSLTITTTMAQRLFLPFVWTELGKCESSHVWNEAEILAPTKWQKAQVWRSECSLIWKIYYHTVKCNPIAIKDQACMCTMAEPPIWQAMAAVITAAHDSQVYFYYVYIYLMIVSMLFDDYNYILLHCDLLYCVCFLIKPVRLSSEGHVSVSWFLKQDELETLAGSSNLGKECGCKTISI